VAQVALCTSLIASVGPVTARLEAALRTPLATVLGDAVVLTVEPASRAFSPAVMTGFAREARRRLGPDLIAIQRSLPGDRLPDIRYQVDRPPSGWDTRPLHTATFDATVMRVEGLSVKNGRLFGGGDGQGTCPVVAINAAGATALLGDDALGRLLVSEGGQPMTVVGVVGQPAQPPPAPYPPPTIWFYGAQGLRADIPPTVDQWRMPANAELRASLTLGTNYLATDDLESIGLSLTEGQSFSPGTGPGSCREALVNEEAAATLGGVPVVGTALVGAGGTRYEIVGVVREATFRTLQARPSPTVFLSLDQQIVPTFHLLVHTPSPPAAMAAVLGGVAGTRISAATRLQARLQQTAHSADRLLTTTLQVLVGLSVVLALVGIAATTADAVTRRTAELALRMALGASRWHVVSTVVASIARLVAIGAGIGASVVIVASWFVEPIPGTAPVADLQMWLGVVAVLAALVALGCAVPVQRAIRLSPAMLLRE
jgi:hypothetical protein